MGTGSVKRKSWLIAAAVVAALAVLYNTVPSLPADVPEGSTASLPSSFVEHSFRTGDVSLSPPGPAIALYNHGWSEDYGDAQLLVLGAYHDRYRQVDVAYERSSSRYAAPSLLSPDGKTVAVGGKTNPDSLALVDLVDGRHRIVGAGTESRGIVPLAWSSDGRYLVARRDWSRRGLPTDGEGKFLVLDLHDGPSYRDLDQIGRMAAFSPDGSEIVAESESNIWIMTRSGT